MYCTTGKGASGQANLDLLEESAVVIQGCRGPWTIGADFHVKPKELR